MCGIAGIAPATGATPATAHRLARMCEAIAHRGPDEKGCGIEDGVGLGMRRLSIIDVAGGHQPIANETGTVRCVYNGEIYNFQELRRDLQTKGHRFRSNSDGEVIPHLWEEYGTEFPTRLNGMFAIALHDRAQKRLILVRDRLGIKPLYYSRHGGHLLFGSEIKALLASELVAPTLGLDALQQFLCWEYVPAPATLFANIEKLEPGVVLDVDLQDLRCRKRTYWDLLPAPAPPASHGHAAEDWEDAVDEKLGQVVRRQLISDVPLGAFLSGGVDSSLIVAHMGHAQTFSIGFEDPSYDESRWSQQVARHLGVAHQVEVIRADAVELFDRLMHFMDDPIGDFSIFPTYLVSRLARRDVVVALSGDGGDELFGGYETYLANNLAALWARIPSSMRKRLLEPLINRLKPSPTKKGLVNKAKRFVDGLQHDTELGHARWRLFASEIQRENLFTPDAKRQMPTPAEQHIRDLHLRAGERPELDKNLYVDLKSYLSDNILVKLDRMSMACSLEARVPYLDHELVELAFSIPSRLKVNHRDTKVLLKRVATRHVPPPCAYRPKEGFSVPVKNWLRTELRPLVEELLSPRRVAGDGLFQVAEVERLKREHQDNRANHSHILWSLLVFQDWHRRWKI